LFGPHLPEDGLLGVLVAASPDRFACSAENITAAPGWVVGQDPDDDAQEVANGETVPFEVKKKRELVPLLLVSRGGVHSPSSGSNPGGDSSTSGNTGAAAVRITAATTSPAAEATAKTREGVASGGDSSRSGRSRRRGEQKRMPSSSPVRFLLRGGVSPAKDDDVRKLTPIAREREQTTTASKPQPCTFQDKVRNAQARGYGGVVVYNDFAEDDAQDQDDDGKKNKNGRSATPTTPAGFGVGGWLVPFTDKTSAANSYDGDSDHGKLVQMGPAKDEAADGNEDGCSRNGTEGGECGIAATTNTSKTTARTTTTTTTTAAAAAAIAIPSIFVSKASGRSLLRLLRVAAEASEKEAFSNLHDSGDGNGDDDGDGDDGDSGDGDDDGDGDDGDGAGQGTNHKSWMELGDDGWVERSTMEKGATGTTATAAAAAAAASAAAATAITVMAAAFAAMAAAVVAAAAAAAPIIVIPRVTTPPTSISLPPPSPPPSSLPLPSQQTAAAKATATASSRSLSPNAHNLSSLSLGEAGNGHGDLKADANGGGGGDDDGDGDVVEWPAASLQVYIEPQAASDVTAVALLSATAVSMALSAFLMLCLAGCVRVGGARAALGLEGTSNGNDTGGGGAGGRFFGPRGPFGRGLLSSAEVEGLASVDHLSAVELPSRQVSTTTKPPVAVEGGGGGEGKAATLPTRQSLETEKELTAAAAGGAAGAGEVQLVTTKNNPLGVSGGSGGGGSGSAGSSGCSICLDPFIKSHQRITSLPCGHLFHHGCISEWLLNWNGTCPLCKLPALKDGNSPSAGALDSALDSATASAPSTVVVRRGGASIASQEEGAFTRELPPPPRDTQPATIPWLAFFHVSSGGVGGEGGHERRRRPDLPTVLSERSPLIGNGTANPTTTTTTDARNGGTSDS